MESGLTATGLHARGALRHGAGQLQAGLEPCRHLAGFRALRKSRDIDCVVADGWETGRVAEREARGLRAIVAP